MSATGNEYPTLAQLKEYGEALKTGNALVGTATGYVARAEDAYAAKPREVRIEGRTVKNLWTNPTGKDGGVTATGNDDGSVTISGTSTRAVAVNLTDILFLKPDTKYTFVIDKKTADGCRFRVGVNYDSGTYVEADAATEGSTFTTPSEVSKTVFQLSVDAATTVSGTYRLMLVEGSEAPDCFTPPASITSVQAGNLVTAGKNLGSFEALAEGAIVSDGITCTLQDDGGIHVEGTKTGAALLSLSGSVPLPSGLEVTLSGVGSGDGITLRWSDVYYGFDATAGTPKTFTSSETGVGRFVIAIDDETVDAVIYPQLELGSTATAYEPPAVTTTPLPEAELRSLPDGTCDELVIGADGTCEVERRTQLTGDEVTALPEPTTESLDAVSLPKLPAPTFNVYHDSQVPSDTSVEYERDVNIAYAELEAKVAALTANVTAATAAGTAQLTVSELAAAKTNSKNIVTA